MVEGQESLSFSSSVGAKEMELKVFSERNNTRDCRQRLIYTKNDTKAECK
jgi:hypothetical protein